MKKTVTAKISLIAALSILLSSCSATLVNLTYEDGQMVNKSAKLAYKAAPINYEPVSVGEAYGYYKKADMILYEIKGLDPKEWLTEEYAGTATTIFYDADITLPTLEELDPDKLYVCYNEEITYSLVTIEDKDTIDTLIDTFTNAEAVDWPISGATRTYELKFYSSETYPQIYYNLTYGQFPEGEFLYDRNTKHAVLIDGLLTEYIGDGT